MTSVATTKPESAPLLSALGCIISPPKYRWFIPDPSRLGAGSSVGSSLTFPPMLLEGPVIGKLQAAVELGAQARKWFDGGKFGLLLLPSQSCHPRGRSSPGILGTTCRGPAAALSVSPTHPLAPPSPQTQVLNSSRTPTLAGPTCLGFFNCLEIREYFQDGFLFN